VVPELGEDLVAAPYVPFLKRHAGFGHAAAFVVLFVVLLAGGLALNTYNLNNAPTSSSEPSLYLGSTIKAKKIDTSHEGTVYRFYFSKESGIQLKDPDMSGRVLEVDRETYNRYDVGAEYAGPVAD
jgi:hypothetical protein